MKGLIIKDLLQLKVYKKNMIISILLYSFIIYINMIDNQGETMGETFIMFLFSSYAMATINLDEKNNSDKYALSLPVTKKELLLSKYILGVSSILIGAILGLVIECIVGYVCYKTFILSKSLLYPVLLIVLAISLMQAVQLPCAYKFGSEKGRLQTYLYVLALIVLVSIISQIEFNITLPNLNILEKFIPIIMVLVMFTIYFVSYKISYKILKNKDY